MAKLPDDCQSMAEVRQGVDQTDRELMQLIERRFGYMRAAARIKATRDSVRDEERKTAVIAAVVEQAKAMNLPSEKIGAIWDQLVETSIAYELEEWDATRK